MTGEEIVGAAVTIHIETDDGQEVRAQKSHNEIAHLNTDVGTRIFASWLPESAYVLQAEKAIDLPEDETGTTAKGVHCVYCVSERE